jgi:hypothetical protein
MGFTRKRSDCGACDFVFADADRQPSSCLPLTCDVSVDIVGTQLTTAPPQHRNAAT